MTSRSEDVIFASLTDVDALEVLAREQVDLEIIPTEGMRQVVDWAIQQYFESGQTKAPSRAALLASWSDTIEGSAVELLPETEELDNVEWALSDLRSRYVTVQFQLWLRKAATEITAAVPEDRVEVLSTQSGILLDLSLRMQSRTDNQDAVDGIRDALADYRARASQGRQMMGMGLGLEVVDNHIFGVHEGELCILAAPAKVGKSHALIWAARAEWRRGRRTVLFSLENSVRMTHGRIACQELCIDSKLWDRGQCSPDEVERVEMWLEAHSEDMRDGLQVISPAPAARTPGAILRQAQILGAQSVVIDQFTWLKHPNPGRKPAWEQAGDMVREVKELIDSPRHRMSCLLAHQITGEGTERATKTGRMRMTDMASAREIERTADKVFGLLQTPEQLKSEMATLQMLADRRVDLKVWDIIWRPWMGDVQVAGEAEEEA